LQSYSIDKAGYVKAYYSGSTTATPIDQILLTTFANPNALQKESGNMLSNPGIAGGNNGGAAGATIATAGPTATQAGDIIQGTLELQMSISPKNSPTSLWRSGLSKRARV
jgi:flagellar hook protein FlgE